MKLTDFWLVWWRDLWTKATHANEVQRIRGEGCRSPLRWRIPSSLSFSSISDPLPAHGYSKLFADYGSGLKEELPANDKAGTPVFEQACDSVQRGRGFRKRNHGTGLAWLLRMFWAGVVFGALLVNPVLTANEPVEGEQISLNGTWDFYPEGGPTRHEIRVPSFWDAPQDYGYPHDWLHMRYGVYRREFHLPPAMAGKSIFLSVGGLSVIGKVFVNGQLVGGEDSLGYLMMQLPYRIDVTQHVKTEGANQLEFRIWGGKSMVHGTESQDDLIQENDFPADTKIDGRFLFPYGVDHWDGRRGITGDVFLVALPRVHVEDVFVLPSLRKNGVPHDDEISVSVTVANRDTASRKILIRNRAIPVRGDRGKDFEPVTITLPASSSMQVFLDDVPWPDAAYWWPHDPALYDLETQLESQGRVVARNRARFGFREFYVKGDHYELNGVRANLRGDAFEFSWHEGYRHGPSTAPVFSTKELVPAMQKELLREYAALNHNMLRPHKASAWVGLHDWCDEHGMMVLEEAPFWETWVRTDERSKPYYEAWVRRWVKARRNHPSIVAWIGANECWYGPTGVIAVQAIRSMDTSRPSFHEDPWGPVKHEDAEEPYEGDEDCRHYTGGYPYRALNTEDLYSVYRANPRKPTGEGESLFPEGLPLMNPDGTLAGKAAERGEFGHPDMVSQATWIRAVCRMFRAMRYAGLSDSRLYANWMYAFDPVESDIPLTWPDLSTPGIKPVILHRPLVNVFDPNLPQGRKAPCHEYYRDSFSAVAVFDKEAVRADRIGQVPTIYKPGEKLTRLLVVHNDTFTGGAEVEVHWAAEAWPAEGGSPKGLASGKVVLPVPLGGMREESVSFDLPQDVPVGSWLNWKLEARKGGQSCFEETTRLGALVKHPAPRLRVLPAELDLRRHTPGHWHTVRLVNLGGGLSETWSAKPESPALLFKQKSGNVRGEQDLHFQVDAGVLPAGDSEHAIEFVGGGGSRSTLKVHCRR